MSLPINENIQPGVTQPESNPSLEPVQNVETTVTKPDEALPNSEGLGETGSKQEIQNNKDEPKVTEPISHPKEEEKASEANLETQNNKVELKVAEPISQPKEAEKVAEAKAETQNNEKEAKLPEPISQPKEEDKVTENKSETQNNEEETKLSEHVSETNEEIKPTESQVEYKLNSESLKEKNSDNSTSQENSENKEGEEESKSKRQYRKRGAKFDDFEKYNDTGSYLPTTSRSGRTIKKAIVFQAAEPAPTKRAKSSASTPADILIKKRGRKPKNGVNGVQAQGNSTKAKGTKRKAGRPKKSDQAATAAINDSKPEDAVNNQDESQSVPSATVDNATIPAILDNQSIPQQDSSISQFPAQLASNSIPQQIPQTFENPALGANQNQSVNNLLPTQPQAALNQFQQPHPIEQPVSTLNSNLPPVSGFQPPVNAGIPPPFNPSSIEQQIINNSASKPGEIPSQFVNPPSAQNQNTFAAPANTTTFN